MDDEVVGERAAPGLDDACRSVTGSGVSDLDGAGLSEVELPFNTTSGEANAGVLPRDATDTGDVMDTL